MVGIYLGSNVRNGELSIGRFDSTRYNDMSYFNAYDYKGLWEMAWNTIDYGTASSRLRNQRGLLLSNSAFIIFNSRNCSFLNILDDFEPIQAQISRQCGGKCRIDRDTHLFSCDVTSSSVSQFNPLILTSGTTSYSIPPENYVEIVQSCLK